MRKHWAAFAVSLVCLTSGLTACRQEALSGPPTLHLGRDECAGCGMIISEDRSSSALLLENAGERSYALFDDIGCMIDYEAAQKNGSVVDRFVHDWQSKAWVNASSAWFVRAPEGKVATPMGSGVVAFADRATAEAKAQEVGGAAVDYEVVRASGVSR
jgi:copper chaperone NosL